MSRFAYLPSYADVYEDAPEHDSDCRCETCQDDAVRLAAEDAAGPQLEITWDGETWETSLGEYCRENRFDPEDCRAVEALAVGESVTLGGGAALAVTVRRVA